MCFLGGLTGAPSEPEFHTPDCLGPSNGPCSSRAIGVPLTNAVNANGLRLGRDQRKRAVRLAWSPSATRLHVG